MRKVVIIIIFDAQYLKFSCYTK